MVGTTYQRDGYDLPTRWVRLTHVVGTTYPGDGYDLPTQWVGHTHPVDKVTHTLNTTYTFMGEF